MNDTIHTRLVDAEFIAIADAAVCLAGRAEVIRGGVVGPGPIRRSGVEEGRGDLLVNVVLLHVRQQVRHDPNVGPGERRIIHVLGV